MDTDAFVVEEYKSVRAEALESIARLQTITQYGLATAGVGIGSALVSARYSTGLAAIVLLALVPMLAWLGAVLVTTEAQRTLRAGWYLRGIEARVNARAERDAIALGWHTMLTRPGYRVRGYTMVPVLVLVTTVLVSAGLGGFLLATRGAWAWLGPVAIAELLGLGAFVVWSVPVRQRIRWFQTAAHDARPPWAGPLAP